MIEVQTARVFKGGGRRFLTKKAAFRAEAKKMALLAFDHAGYSRIRGRDRHGAPLGEWDDAAEAQYQRCVAFLARVYKRVDAAGRVRP